MGLLRITIHLFKWMEQHLVCLQNGKVVQPRHQEMLVRLMYIPIPLLKLEARRLQYWPLKQNLRKEQACPHGQTLKLN